MLAFAKGHVPFFRFNVASINRACEHFIDALISDFAVWEVLGECVLALKESFDLDLSFKTSTSIAFKGFLQD